MPIGEMTDGELGDRIASMCDADLFREPSSIDATY